MDLRVHGNKVLRRRTVKEEKRYETRKGILEEDFQGICGYCAKSSKTFVENFQIDHFAPKTRFPERRNDYSNLVLACPQCNRLKSDKWVTQDPFISHTEKEGFIDPATEEFDEHLGRRSNGEIYAKTPIGEYMCKTFKFEIRPIRIMWKIMKLKELRQKLKDDNSKKGLTHYKEITEMLDQLIEYIRFDKNE